MYAEKLNGTWVVLLMICTFGMITSIRDNIRYLEKVRLLQGRTSGQIVDLVTKKPDGSILTYGTYTYTINDSLYTNYELLGVGLNFRPFLKEGDELTVKYDQRNPQTATAVSEEDFYPNYVICGVIIVAALTFIRSKE